MWPDAPAPECRGPSPTHAAFSGAIQCAREIRATRCNPPARSSDGDRTSHRSGAGRLGKRRVGLEVPARQVVQRHVELQIHRAASVVAASGVEQSQGLYPALAGRGLPCNPNTCAMKSLSIDESGAGQTSRVSSRHCLCLLVYQPPTYPGVEGGRGLARPCEAGASYLAIHVRDLKY